MNNHILRATAKNGEIRAFVIESTDMVETARKIHGTSPVATAALGRALTGASMMGSMMKGDDDIMTMLFRGDGPINGVTVTSDSKGNVKGYVGNPNIEMELNYLGKLDVGGAIGYGTLTVIKDLGLKEPYSGTISLTTSEVAEDLAYYFASSEQVPSAVALGVLVDTDLTVKAAGGFIIQLMPFAEESTIEYLEKKLETTDPVTTMLSNGLTTEDILNTLLGDYDVTILDTIPVDYKCNCSRDKTRRALISIGKDEINSLIAEGKDVEMECHFCNKKYVFTIDDLKELL